MKHQQAELIKAYAEDTRTMFIPIKGNVPYDLQSMLDASRLNPEWEWTIYDKWVKERQAFANGKKIEISGDGIHWDELVLKDPEWTSSYYRIAEPVKVTKWLWVNSRSEVNDVLLSEKDANEVGYFIKLEGTATEVEV